MEQSRIHKEHTIEVDSEWGWNQSITNQFEVTYIGRITGRYRNRYSVQVKTNTRWEEQTNIQCLGAFENKLIQPDQFPAVGDWVTLAGNDQTVKISGLIPRISQLGRKVAGKQTIHQILAANITHVLIVLALDGGRNFLLRFLERALIAAWNSGAQPIIILNKSDCAPPDVINQAKEDAEFAAPGCPVVPISATHGMGIDELMVHFQPGDTLCMIGKSGVGKSALVNRLFQWSKDKSVEDSTHITKEGTIRESDREGRHTTTDSRLYRLPSGVLIIDGPGIRELQIWAEEHDVDLVFQEISELKENCKFNDCTHQGEPGCAVQEALVQGVLDQNRYESYLELMREQAYVERKQNIRAMRDEKLKWKQISKSMKHYKKSGRNYD
jgi:ribosome biogenesis GTPase